MFSPARAQFTPEAVSEIAKLAEDINLMMDNIGARRLHTVLERIVDNLSFDAPDKASRAPSPPPPPQLKSSASGSESNGVPLRTLHQHCSLIWLSFSLFRQIH